MKIMIKRLLKSLWFYTQLLFIRIAETSEDLIDSSMQQLAGKDHSLSAKFAPEKSLLSARNKGFILTGTKAITSDFSRKGTLISGGSGSGKSTVVGIPNCLTTEHSKMIHDPSGELYSASAAYLQSQGYTIIRIDWSRANSSYAYNPLHRVHSLADYSKLATQLVESSSNKKEKNSFWNSMAIQLLVCMIRIVKQLPKAYQTLTQVAHLIDLLQSPSGQKEVDKLVANVSGADDSLFDKYTSLIGNSENTFSGIVASATTAVQMFALDEEIIRITSTDTLEDFKKWRKRKTAVFIQSSTVNMSYYAPLSSLFFQQYFESLFESLPSDDELDMDFILDEAPILTIELDVLAANVRKYSGSLLIICQDAENQISNTFGKERARSILANLKTHLYLTTNLETAQRLSKELGSYEYTDTKTGRVQRRELLTPDEILSLSADKGLITIAGQRPVLAKLTPFYNIPRLVKKTELSAIDNEMTHKESPVGLLNIPQYLDSLKSSPSQKTTIHEQ